MRNRQPASSLPFSRGILLLFFLASCLFLLILFKAPKPNPNLQSERSPLPPLPSHRNLPIIPSEAYAEPTAVPEAEVADEAQREAEAEFERPAERPGSTQEAGPAAPPGQPRSGFRTPELWTEARRLVREWMDAVAAPLPEPVFGRVHLDIVNPWSGAARMWPDNPGSVYVTVETHPSPWNPRLPCFDLRWSVARAGRMDLLPAAQRLERYDPKMRNGLNMSRPEAWEPENDAYEEWLGGTGLWDNFACLPTSYVVGTAKGATTAFFNMAIQHPDVPQLGKKEQEFWNRADPHETRWLKEFYKYARRYGYHTWEWEGAHPVDTSPLYWRAPDIHRQITRLVPHARAVVFLREPVARTLSCYKYFCLQESRPRAECSTQEFERRLLQGVARARYIACEELDERPDWCAEFPPVQLLRGRQRYHVREPFNISNERAFTDDPWPLTDPGLMSQIYERAWWAHNADTGVMMCGLLESLFWRDLADAMRYWTPGNIKVVMTEDFQEQPVDTARQLFEFYGLANFTPTLPTDARLANKADDAKRRSKDVVMTKKAQRLLEKIFQPHLVALVDLLQGYIDDARDLTPDLPQEEP